MRSVTRLVVAVGVWLSFSQAGSAQSDDAHDANVARARELFQRGVEAYDRGVYFEALQAFQEAYQLRPHPSVRVNIANCYDKLDRPAEAIQNFEQFLGSGAGTPKQQEEVVQALPQLRRRVGRLVLRITPDGSRVVLDNTDQYRSPFNEPILLKVGRHQVTASHDGHETAMRVVDIRSDETTELSIDLLRFDTAEAPTPNPPPVAAAPPPAETAEAARPPRVIPPELLEDGPDLPEDEDEEVTSGVPAAVWVAGGVSVAALLTSIVTGQLALAADREFNGELAAVRNMQLSNVERAMAWSGGLAAADRAQAYAITTDVLLSTAVVGAVLTTVLYLNHRADLDEGETELEAAGESLRVRAAF